MKCHIDIETFSGCDLTKTGVYKYAKDFSTIVHCIGYAIGGEEAKVWVPEEPEKKEYIAYHCEIGHDNDNLVMSKTMPKDLWDAMTSGELYAFNAEFEWVMLNKSWWAQTHDIPKTSMEQWHCTQAQAACASMPRSLKQVAKALMLTEQKDDHGRVEMLYLSSPKKPTALDPSEVWDIDKHTDRFIKLYEYCAQDVRVERGIAYALPPMSKQERESFLLNMKINDTGLTIDMPSVKRMRKARDQYLDIVQQDVAQMTGETTRSAGAITQWLRDPDRAAGRIVMPDMRGSTRDAAIDELNKRLSKIEYQDERHQAAIKDSIKVLENISALLTKATSKLDAMEIAAVPISPDCGKLHGMFVYHGANTGRASSQIVQLQNLKRPDGNIDTYKVIAMLRRDDGDWKSTAELYDVPYMSVLGSSMRALIYAKPSHELVWGDFGQIEARVLAWLAGAEDRLKVFAAGEDIYRHAAAKIFGKKISDISKDSKERFLGKVAELALGYQGGAKAFTRMSQAFNVDISEDKAEQIKKAWRKANPKIAGRQGLWNRLSEAAINAVKTGKTTSWPGSHVSFSLEDNWLCLNLPSGRKMRYYQPQVEADRLTYYSVDTFKRQWGRCDTFGGRLAENAASAIAFDLLDAAMKEAQYELQWIEGNIVAHVHDEIVTEVPEHAIDEAQTILKEAMSRPQEWCKTLPLVADVKSAYRYGK